MTGYHLLMFLLPMLIFHSGFFFGLKWTPITELMIWSLYFSFDQIWDLLWFILNPYYTISRFKKENIWWYKKSYWVANLIPFDYVSSWLLSVGFGLMASLLSANFSYLTEVGLRFVVFSVLIFLTTIFAPRYHSFYFAIRKDDE